jgi:hypothetical protein
MNSFCSFIFRCNLSSIKGCRELWMEKRETERNTPREKEKLRREKEREPVSGTLGVFGDLGL